MVMRDVTVTVWTLVCVLTSVAVLVGVVGCATSRQSQSCWIRGSGRSPRDWRASRAGSGMARRRRPKTVVSSVTVAVMVLTEVLGCVSMGLRRGWEGAYAVSVAVVNLVTVTYAEVVLVVVTALGEC